MAKPKKQADQVEQPVEAASAPVTISYKGFDSSLSCRGFKFEIGQTYSVPGKIEACYNGFHACPEEHHPLSVFEFYPPAGSRYCTVEQSGETNAQATKLASASITIKAEIHLSELIQAAVKWVFERAKWSEGPVATGENEGATASGTRGAATASGDQGAATASGDQGAATASGYQGAATASGDQGAATASGYQGAATASGTRGAATASGTRGAATASGDQGAATASGTRGAATASGYQGAATASGYQGAATASGYQGAATASGTRGAATASGTRGAATASGTRGAATASGTRGAATASGDQGAATASGDQSVACALGFEGKAKAGAGGAIVLVARRAPWDGGEILHIVAAKVGDIVGGVTIEPDVFYRLTNAGQVEKVED